MGRGRLIVIIAILAIIAAGGGAGFVLANDIKGFLVSKGWIKPAGDAAKPAEPPPPPEIPKTCNPEVCYEMPDTIVSLGGGSNHILRLAMTIQMSDKEGVSTLTALLPRVQDAFQVYLRNVSIADIKGAENTQRLRVELLKRMNAVIPPAKAEQILFREVLIQ